MYINLDRELDETDRENLAYMGHYPKVLIVCPDAINNFNLHPEL